SRLGTAWERAADVPDGTRPHRLARSRDADDRRGNARHRDQRRRVGRTSGWRVIELGTGGKAVSRHGRDHPQRAARSIQLVLGGSQMSEERMPEQAFRSALERPMSRLALLKRTAGLAGAAAAGGALVGREAQAKPAAAEAPPPPLRFFTQWEFDYVTSMAETIWPTD